MIEKLDNQLEIYIEKSAWRCGMLYRKIEKVIEEHLESNSGKVLLIDGAR